jgi:bacteriocin-like protein
MKDGRNIQIDDLDPGYQQTLSEEELSKIQGGTQYVLFKADGVPVRSKASVALDIYSAHGSGDGT